MRHIGPSGTGGKRGAARIGEQIQHARRRSGRIVHPGRRHGRRHGPGSAALRRTGSAGRRRPAVCTACTGQGIGSQSSASQGPAAVVDEIPVGRLFGKNPHVFERREPQPHAQLHPVMTVRHRPARRHLRLHAPLAAFVVTRVAHERRIGPAAPLLLGEAAPPDRLRLGAPRHKVSEALEFLEIARINQFVIPEIGGQLFLHIAITHYFLRGRTRTDGRTGKSGRRIGTRRIQAGPDRTHSSVRYRFGCNRNRNV